MSRKKLQQGLNVVGKTKNGDLVVSGLFRLFDTGGLPFTIIFEQLRHNNFVVSWNCLYSEAMRHGWKWSTLRSRIQESISEVFGKSYCEHVINKLDMLDHLQNVVETQTAEMQKELHSETQTITMDLVLYRSDGIQSKQFTGLSLAI